jgi:hypothetical protein
LVDRAKKALHNSRRINKRKSNLYSHLKSDSKVSKVGITALTNKNIPTSNENIIERKHFYKFIINSNTLAPIEIEDAEIDIVSPVITDGNYAWKGIYQDELISFQMLDLKFKDEILRKRVPFYTDTRIICTLRFDQILDDLGDVKIKKISVITVLDTIESGVVTQTSQGKAHRHTKLLTDNQQDLFSKT